ncbi:MAG: hypothetical protein Phog2KO_38390 [Phototrophicaceae bacterium]
MTKLVGELIRERRKRKGWSQTILGDFVGMSAATIHRIEHGEKIPTDQEANLIAGFLGIEHSLILEACQLSYDEHPQLPKTAYKLNWETAHPASYSGAVWIQISPQAEFRHEAHHFTLRWGAWERKGNFLLPDNQDAVFLRHYKHNDGLGLPLFLTLSHPCYVVFGKTDLTDDSIDINLQWRRVEPMPPDILWRYTKSYCAWFWARLFAKK